MPWPEAAKVMSEHWSASEIRACGSAIFLDRLWMTPSHGAGDVWLTMSAFLDTHMQGALLLLKPFPLEYEGAFSRDDKGPKPAFERRLAAMQRLYARPGVLDAEAIGATGWMWRPLHPEMQSPELRPTSHRSAGMHR